MFVESLSNPIIPFKSSCEVKCKNLSKNQTLYRVRVILFTNVFDLLNKRFSSKLTFVIKL